MPDGTPLLICSSSRTFPSGSLTHAIQKETSLSLSKSSTDRQLLHGCHPRYSTRRYTKRSSVKVQAGHRLRRNCCLDECTLGGGESAGPAAGERPDYGDVAGALWFDHCLLVGGAGVAAEPSLSPRVVKRSLAGIN